MFNTNAKKRYRAPRKMALPRGMQISFKNLSGFERLERAAWGNWVSSI
jgi:hypothetical protein